MLHKEADCKMKLILLSASILLFGGFVHSDKVAMPDRPIRPSVWRPPTMGPSFFDPKENETIKYVALFPTVFQPSKDFSFYMTFFQNDSAYSLPVTFVANMTANGVLISSQTFTQRSYGVQMHTFTGLGGKNLGDQYSYVSVTVGFTTDSLKNYTDVASSGSVLVDKFVFVQTDKAMYKPSQTVNLRVVAVGRDLTGLTSNSVNVTIQDPKNSLVKAWTNQALYKGTFNATFSLSDFVNLGQWRITVVGAGLPKTEKTFTVQQYVLPKYEVKLDFLQPSTNRDYWLFNPDSDTGYVGHIRAKYTFGKPVKGVANVTLVTTGSCSYMYDVGGQLSMIKRPGPVSPPMPTTNSKKVATTTLKADGSDDDGKFVLVGLNDVVSNKDASNVALTGNKLNNEQCQLTFTVNVTEELTGEVITSTGRVTLYRDPYKISTHDSVQKTLKPGLPFTMRFQVSTPDNKPASNIMVKQDVYFLYNNTASTSVRSTCGYVMMPRNGEVEATPVASTTSATDSDGIISIKVTVPKNVTSVLFKARLSDFSVEACETKAPPQSNSKQAVSISIDRPVSAAKTTPKVGDTLTFKIEASFRVPMVYFMLVQNGQPIVFEQLSNPQKIDDTSTTFSTTRTLPQEAAPRVSAVVWTVENKTGEILADALTFKLDGLMRQTMSASFTPQTVKPHGQTTLTISTAEANSFVGVLAVDKSVTLLQSGNDITLDDVMGAVGEGKTSAGGYRPFSPVLWRCWRCGWWPSWIDSSTADQVFSGISMVIKSNVRTGFFTPPIVTYSLPMMGGAVARRGDMAGEVAVMDKAAVPMPSAPGAARGPAQPDPAPIRMLFPETWLWNGTTTDGAGKLVWQLTAPDTITSWELSAFSIGNSKGFGALESPAELSVFQDFFVNLDIAQPTIIRGEQVQIKGVVFNYQSVDDSISLILRKSSDFNVSLDDGATYQSADFTKVVTVKANSGSSVPIWIKPNTLGTIKMNLVGTGRALSDAMIKEILVEPEGEIRYANKPTLVRLSAGSNNRLVAKIEVSKMLGDVTNDMVVEGSKMFQLQAIGDILGPALSQLGSQIRMPTGCGEQTMLSLAPNVYIYKYLKAVNLLTDELATKTTGFIDQGYQRELTFQRDDGGFSAFGNSDTASSTWLTAFVLRCFASAKKYVNTQIPSEPINKAWQFLKRQGLQSGSFTEPGRVIHTDMKGGASGDLNLAIYVYTTAAEAEVDAILLPSLPAARQRIITAARSPATLADPYQLAIITYALSIRQEDRQEAQTALTKLMSVATNDSSGLTYWIPAGDKSTNTDYSQARPSQVETSGYALLAVLNIRGAPEDAIPVGRWLMSKRNSLGGFSSTQDTVVGLQALSELASRLGSEGQSLTVVATLNFADQTTSSTTFNIDASNSQTLFSFDPPRDKQNLDTVSLDVRGTGVGLVQLAMRYNVRNQKVLDSGDYFISVTRTPMARRKRRSADTNQNDDGSTLADPAVNLTACVRPQRVKQEMVLLEVGTPTGFDVNLAATQAANKSPRPPTNLKRIELGTRKVVFYFDALDNTRTQTCVQVSLTRIAAARTVQPPIARVYAYYEPSRINATEYLFPGMSLVEQDPDNDDE